MRLMEKITALVSATLAIILLLAAFSPVQARQDQPAAVAAFAKNDGQGQLICFTQEDFTSRVSGGEELSAIVLKNLPAGGILRLAESI